MTENQPLTSVVTDGLSLVLCTGERDQMLAVENALARARLTCVSTRWMTSMRCIDYARAWLDAMTHRHINDRGLVIVSRVPVLTLGYRLPFHRIVWIGDKPKITSPLYATYVQAIGRGNPDTPVIHFNGELE